jgi:signal transduction histidine kinase
LLRNDFGDLKIELNQDAVIRADKRAILSVVRNIFQNSVLHGKADLIQIEAHPIGQNIRVSILDNGSGFLGDLQKIGEEILQSQDSRGNGIGLLLSKRLINKMKGNLQFSTSTNGFKAEIQIPGGLA